MTYSIPTKYPEPVYITDVIVGPHQTPEQESTDDWTIVVEVTEYDSITSEPIQYEDEVVGALSELYEITPGRVYQLYWNEEGD